MPRRPRPITVTVPLPTADYRVYESAAKILRRIMRDHAPDVVMLIQSKLVKHDATGVVEDYLERVDWPQAERPLILPRPGSRGRESVRLQSPARRGRPSLKVQPLRCRPPADPSRN